MSRRATPSAELARPVAAAGTPLPAEPSAVARLRGGVRVIEPASPGLREAWREAWSYRHLFLYFGHRLLRKRYARTWLGALWIPLRPVANLGARILVFGGLIGIAVGRIPYALYFVVATALWMLFAETLLWGARSLELNRKLLRQVHVPRLLLASAGLVPGFAEFGVYCACAVLAVVYYYVRVGTIYLSFGRATLLVPAGIALTALLGAGTAVLIAGFGRRARDMRFALSYLLGFMYFMTPVIYPLSSVPNKWRPLAELNPLTGAMEMVKHGLFASETFSLDAAYVTLIATALIWGPGLWLVHRRELRLVQGGEP